MSAQGKSLVNGYKLGQTLIHAQKGIHNIPYHNISDYPLAAPKRSKVKGPHEELCELMGPKALVWAVCV